MPSYLPEDAQVLFITDAPREQEDLQGTMPLIGKEGAVLNDCIHLAGFDRFDPIFGVMQVVNCYPPLATASSSSRPLKDVEIKACSSYFEEDVKQLKQLKVIVCLGTVATNKVFGKLGLNISSLRQYPIWHPKYNAHIVSTYHPSAVLKATSFYEKSALKGALIEDIMKAVKLTQYHYEPLQHQSYVCDSMSRVRWLFEQLNQQELVAWDTETDSLDYLSSEILCHSFSWKIGTGVVLPILGQYNKAVWKEEELKEIQALLKDFLENDKIKKIAHNGKYDKQTCRNHGINVQNLYADTMIMHYLANENIDHGLKLLAWLYTDYGGYDEDLKNIVKTYAKELDIAAKSASYNILPTDILWPYASKDTDTTLQLYFKLLPILEQERTDIIFFELYMPFVNLIADIEFEGVNIDREYLTTTKQQYLDRIQHLEKAILEEPSVKEFISRKKQVCIAAREKKWLSSKALQKRYTKDDYCDKIDPEDIEFNYSSTKQLKELIIDQLKFKALKKTDKGNPSFDAATMEMYAKKLPVAKIIAEINKATHLMTNFLEGMEDRIRKDGRVHTSLNVHVADTGRLSSSDPNLQNIPNRTNNPTDAKLIRDIFIADTPDHLIVEFDEKQAEFRIWCQLSQDPVMRQDLANGLDIHTEIASEGFKIPKDQVTKEKRDGAKGVVFGKMYGRGNRSVSEALGISLKEAERIESTLFSKYKIASGWLRNTVIFAKQHGYVENCFHFRRHLHDLVNSTDPDVKAAAERLAVNSPIQGGASQMVCYAMLRIQESFRDNNIRGRILFPIHDAILCNIHKDDIRKAIPLIEYSMTHPHPAINVPLGVDGKIGYKWGSAVSVEEYLNTSV